MRGKNGWYWYGCCVWFINVIFAVAAYFVHGIRDVCPILFIFVFICFGSYVVQRNRDHAESGELVLLVDALSGCPGWCRTAMAVSVLYGFANLFVCLYFLREGGPHIADGVYCLWEHGFVREITREEYDSLVLVQGRMFTGIMLPLSAIPLTFWASRKS